MTPIHIQAIDWALSKGYMLSVRDVSEDEFDLVLSDQRAEIIDAVEATDLPNVFITDGSNRIAVFSVIDEGIPAETINDYIAEPNGEFDQWYNSI